MRPFLAVGLVLLALGELVLLVLSGLVLLAMSGLPAPAASDDASPAELARPFVPSISIQPDSNQSPGAAAGGFAWGQPGAGFSASGIVRCGGAIGTAQLVLRADLIVTAGHVLVGPQGPRGGACIFEPAAGGGAVAIEEHSIRSGSARPLADPAARDWAVARLAAAISGARPYALAAPPGVPAAVAMYAGGHGRADGMAVERCSARYFIGTSAQGVREVAIDCNAAPGASGAALLDARHRAWAIYVGYRSANPDQPQPFSRTHYNFAISIEGPFRRAVQASAGGR
jgi:hypothetical protein